MATVGTTSRPSYVYDQETDTWVPVGVGPHTHDNFVTATTIDAKGDLLAGLSPDTVGRLPIGANGTMLVADSTQTLGMAWSNVISANSSTDAFRITQIGSGNALVVEDSANPDSSPFVINTSGQVFIGKTTANALANYNRAVQNEGTGASTVGFSTIRNSNDASAPAFEFGKSRGTSIGGVTAVTSGDSLGLINFGGADGASMVPNAAQIVVNVDGTVSTGVIPSRISFHTVPVSGTGIFERMRIDSNGLVTAYESIKATKGFLYNINPQTSTSYTAAVNDAGSIVTTSNSSANTFFINTDAAVLFPDGTSINIIQIGTGTTTIQATTPGTTVVASNAATSTAPKLRTQYSSATAIKIASNTWYVVGDIV